MADDKLAAAIREAEEWLAHYDDTVAAVPPGSADPPEVRLLRALPPSVEAAAEDVVRGDWWGHYCPSCGSTAKHGPECRIGRLAKALDSARAAKGGAS